MSEKINDKCDNPGCGHDHDHAHGSLPPMTFIQLVNTFFMQTMVMLGKEMNPITEKFERDMVMAKYHIDIMEILKEKTKGNLTDEEEEHLDTMLLNLRLAWVDETSREKK